MNPCIAVCYDVRVWSSIGHGEKEWLVVGELEVLISELLAVDGLATSALKQSLASIVIVFPCSLNVRYHG